MRCPASAPSGMPLRNERGVVLLIVLIIVALLTIVVMEFTFSVQIDQHRTRNAVHALQAQLLARSGVNLAEGFLMLDDDPTYDAYSEDWWLQLDEFCKGLQLDETMRLRCRVRDESGKLNINSTRGVQRRFNTDQMTGDAILRDAVRCLFSRRNINLDTVDKLFDYWQQDPKIRDDGTPQQIPDFTSLEDFAATVGIPNDQVHQLRNVMTAQPVLQLPRINVNTAPSEVLNAVLTDNAPADCSSNDGIVQQILQRRQDPDGAFRNAGDINGVITGIQNADLKRRLFDIRSKLFRLEASALTNVDPTNPSPTGIGQTLSVLVSRRQSTTQLRAPGGQATGGQPAGGIGAQRGGVNTQQPPSWTLRPLDWQKEGGARLFRTAPTDDGLPGSSDQEESDVSAPAMNR
jgi:type II secretory pathway component PulK